MLIDAFLCIGVELAAFVALLKPFCSLHAVLKSKIPATAGVAVSVAAVESWRGVTGWKDAEEADSVYNAMKKAVF